MLELFVADPVMLPTTGLSELVDTATGWFGLVIIFVYSFLIAFILPGVSEVVLFAPLDIGLSYWPRMALIVIVSSLGKMAGSILAFYIGRGVKESGPMEAVYDAIPFNIREWSERKTLDIAQKYGFVGLTLLLAVPGFPDTISIYAFSVLEDDYIRFALATFLGSVGRLVVTLLAINGFSFIFF